MFRLAILFFLFHPFILCIEFNYMVNVEASENPVDGEDFNLGSKFLKGSRKRHHQKKPTHQNFFKSEFDYNYQDVLDIELLEKKRNDHNKKKPNDIYSTNRKVKKWQEMRKLSG